MKPVFIFRPTEGGRWHTISGQSDMYEDRLKIDRLEDRTSLCWVKNENFLCHFNVLGIAHQPTVQGSCDHSQITSFNHLKIG